LGQFVFRGVVSGVSSWACRRVARFFALAKQSLLNAVVLEND
jgi:hypothetical protein